MSKSGLRKQLAQMSREQIVELMVELYDARREAKDYLDFFVNPDIDGRLDKARVGIKKELVRSSKGRNKARISRVRRYIKDISSLNPGVEPVVEIMTYAVETACSVGNRMWIKDSTQQAFAKLMADTLLIAEDDFALKRMEKAVGAMDSERVYASEFRELMMQTLEGVKDGL